MTRKQLETRGKALAKDLEALRVRYAKAKTAGEREQIHYAGTKLNEALEALRKAYTAMDLVRGW